MKEPSILDAQFIGAAVAARFLLGPSLIYDTLCSHSDLMGLLDMFYVQLEGRPIGNNSSMIEDFKKVMEKEFEMTVLGLMSYFLGIEVVQNEKGIFISQKRYATEFLKKFDMLDWNPVKTPVEVGTKLSKEGDDRLVDSTLNKLWEA